MSGLAEKYGKIEIKPENRGKFTKHCKQEGYKSVTQECIDKAKKSKSKSLRKQATFADNARKWSK
jgi:hypothetical protein